MAVEERDPVSGRQTTGHEWNGIRELDTPVPRGVLIFLIVTHVFAIAWWVLMPAWPLGETSTQGLLETDQHKEVAANLRDAELARASWVQAIERASPAQIAADPQLMAIVNSTGQRLFGDNCAACHGTDAKGGFGYPDLTDRQWQWGGSVEEIAATMRTGINTEHPESPVAQMPGFGEGIMEYEQIGATAEYVYSLSHPRFVTAENRQTIAEGREIFETNCSVCHGETGRGNPEVGAPDLTDRYWVYGGELENIIETIHHGRQGHMPTWDERLSEVEIKILALYVHSLGGGGP